MDQLRHELEAVGFYLSAHPLDSYGAVLEKLDITWAADMAARIEREGNIIFKMAGTVLSRQERRSAKGNRFAFVTLSDPTGVFEVTMFSEALAQSRELLEAGVPLLLTLEGEWRDDTPRLTVQRVESLDEVAAAASKGLYIYLDNPRPVPQLKRLIEREGEGRGRIAFMLEIDLDGERQEVEVELGRRYAITPGLRAAIKTTPGVIEAREM